MTSNAHIEMLNRRLGEALGFVCGGFLPRFAWKYAPDMPMIFYDKDDRTVRKLSWASAPDVNGGRIGRQWLLANWRRMGHSDHHGYGEGPRIPLVAEAGYSPYFETACGPEVIPSEELNAMYIVDLRRRLAASAECRENAYDEYLAKELVRKELNEERQRDAWREEAMKGYDNHVGAYGNCLPGTRGGYLSLPSRSSDLSAFEGI